MSRRTQLVSAAAVLMLLVAALGGVAAADTTVQAKDFVFDDATVTIAVGDTVTWTFSGEFHSVTSGQPGSPDGSFDSGLVSAGGTYERMFTAAGTVPYFCLVHSEQMTGTIVVGGAATPTPRPSPAPTPRPTPRPTPAPTPAPTPPTAAPTLPPASATSGPSESAGQPTDSPSASAIASEPASSPSPSPSGGTAPGADGEGEIPLVALIGGGLAIGALAAFIALRRRAA